MFEYHLAVGRLTIGRFAIIRFMDCQSVIDPMACDSTHIIQPSLKGTVYMCVDSTLYGAKQSNN